VFVDDQTIEDIVKIKEKVPESTPVGVPPQRQQQDRDDSDPSPADSAQQEAENVPAEDVQDDAHSGTCGGEYASQRQQYDDAEEDDHDQQEAPLPDSPPAAPLRRSSRDRVPSTTYASDQYVVLLSDSSEPECFSEAMKNEKKKKEWNKAM
jgi:hypothetical protein